MNSGIKFVGAVLAVATVLSTASPIFADGWNYRDSGVFTQPVATGRLVLKSTVDSGPLMIKSVDFTTDATMATIVASGTDIVGIYVNGSYYPGFTIDYHIPPGTKYLGIQAANNDGLRSEVRTWRVPGWTQITPTISIEPVKFSSGNTCVTINAVSDTAGTSITGIYIDGELHKGNPVTYSIPKAAKYLQLQAENNKGDKSALYDIRVPGWNDILRSIVITTAEFTDDNTLIMARASETEGKGVAGIYINDEFHKGNPILCEIPTGAKHLVLQAENGQGDRSAPVTLRVPGWSQITDTLKVSSVEFTGNNTLATITAAETTGKEKGIRGIYVNDTFLDGNPVVYTIPADSEKLKMQAENSNGDLSAAVNRDVPKATVSEPEKPDTDEKSPLNISIKEPDWSNKKSAKVKVTVTEKDEAKIEEILACTESDEWEDITSTGYLTITENETVRVKVTDTVGRERESSKEIECFDREIPTVSANQSGETVSIRADDRESGIERVTVAGNSYSASEAKSGISYKPSNGETTVQIVAEDHAGNLRTRIHKRLSKV